MLRWLRKRTIEDKTAEQVLKAFRRRHWFLHLRVKLFPPKPWGLDHWVGEGFLCPAANLADAWQLPAGEFETAFKSTLFRVRLREEWYVPQCWTALEMADVVTVCDALSGGDVVSKLLFWKQRHGGIGAQTAAEALKAGKLRRVVELATAEALENGWRV